MPTRKFKLTDEQDAFLTRMVRAGKYQSTSEAVRDAIHGLQHRSNEDELKLKTLRMQIEAGGAALDRGDFTEIAEADLDSALDRLIDR